jgi:hypothetical protein
LDGLDGVRPVTETVEGLLVRLAELGGIAERIGGNFGGEFFVKVGGVSGRGLLISL